MFMIILKSYLKKGYLIRILYTRETITLTQVNETLKVLSLVCLGLFFATSLLIHIYPEPPQSTTLSLLFENVFFNIENAQKNYNKLIFEVDNFSTDPEKMNIINVKLSDNEQTLRGIVNARKIMEYIHKNSKTADLNAINYFLTHNSIKNFDTFADYIKHVNDFEIEYLNLCQL